VSRWVAFAALTLVVVAFLLASARASERVVSELTTQSEPSQGLDELDDGADHLDVAGQLGPRATGEQRVSALALLANVGVSHALFAGILIAGIWLAEIPVRALGLETDSIGLEAIAVGIAVGAALAAGNAALGRVVDADPSARLRELLTPATTRGWALLLAVVLPIIAGFEELLFRGILVGAFAAGFALSPWFLAVGSSIVFAAGHGAQGRLGIAVTGVLGLALATVFVVTDSLLVVVIAHYIVNAVEFVDEHR
jgi:membrane protease YdiL (CAAX protease family)